jgi:hypothetical protein
MVTGSRRVAELRPGLVGSRRKNLERGIEPWRSRPTYRRGSPLAEQLAEEDCAPGEDDGDQGDTDQQRNAGNDHHDPDDDDGDA